MSQSEVAFTSDYLEIFGEQKGKLTLIKARRFNKP